MSETKQILSLLAITLAIASLGVIAVASAPKLFLDTDDDISITDYQAVLSLDGTLSELFTYEIKSPARYRMLYRVWDVPLVFEEKDFPSVQIEEIASPRSGIYTYAKDMTGSVLLEPADARAHDLVAELAYSNEAGIVNPDYFDAGIYQIEYTFILYPPIEFDDEYCHLNLKLASDHLAYKHVTITIEGADKIEAVYHHPPTLSMERADNQVIIRGASPEDSLLEVELLLKKEVLSEMRGFPNRVEGVKVKTQTANLVYALPYHIAVAIKYISYLIMFLLPASFAYIYQRHGREKSYTIPKFLSYTPQKRKPWLVNLIFKGDIGDFDHDGLYATLLDLHQRGKIKIGVKNPSRGKKAGLQIQVIDPTGFEDDYERKVIQFFSENASEGSFDTDRVKDLLEKAKKMTYAPSELVQMKNTLNRLVSYSNPKTTSEFAMSGRKRVSKLLIIPGIFLTISILLIIFASYVFEIAIVSTLLSIMGVIQIVLGLIYPSTLFGKWKGEHYREKMEWDAFRNMLSDLAQIKRYAPQDLVMWGEWLIYGTSLGVGDKVAEAMRDLHIELPDLNNFIMLPLIMRPVITTPIITKSSSSGGRGGSFGGGFGGGGGLGGGGGGAR